MRLKVMLSSVMRSASSRTLSRVASVAVHAGELVAEQRALHVVAGGGVLGGNIDGCKGLVDVAVERERYTFGADGLGELLGGVADLGDGVNHEHDAGLAGRPCGGAIGRGRRERGCCPRCGWVATREQLLNLRARFRKMVFGPCAGNLRGRFAIPSV